MKKIFLALLLIFIPAFCFAWTDSTGSTQTAITTDYATSDIINKVYDSTLEKIKTTVDNSSMTPVKVSNYIWTGAQWVEALSEGTTNHNQRITLYYGINQVQVGQMASDGVSSSLYSLFTKGHLYGYNGATWDRIRSVDGGLETMTHIETTIHNGEHFRVVDYEGDLDTTWKKYVLSSTAATTKLCEFNCTIASSFNGTFFLYEDAILSDYGTSMTILNSYRDSTNTSEMLFFEDVVVTSSGTLIASAVLGSDGATPVGAEGGLRRREKQIILKNDTYYLILIQTLTNNTRVSMDFYWQED